LINFGVGVDFSSFFFCSRRVFSRAKIK